ncbi:Hypothetical predicted protein [Cloeon dipterum]|uniref:F-box domain-containing protein n=1 Tax=Cloeon dipterum TaxID=197152 RepID=A0A8S1DPY8_9INSE|nr:Hypothetical predicted protein [Cloeon dipterum]
MRLLALKKPKSLKQLAVGIIARGIVEYVMEPEKELQFPIIPDNVKQTVLDEVACIAKKTQKPRNFDIDGDFIKRSGLILDNLLSLNTVEFDSSWLLQISPHDSESGYIQILLQSVSLRAPNLKFLIIGGDDPSSNCKVYPCSMSMLSCIRNMQNLTHFVTDSCCFTLKQLMELCSSLELLQFVNVKNLEINDQHEYNFDKLRRLKEFHFNKVKSSMPRLYGSSKKDLILKCLKHLPNLEVIGEMVERKSSFDFCHPAVIEGPSKLRHLFASPASIQEFQRFERIFPATTHLAINWKCMNLPISGGQNLQFPYFPRLKCVKMKSVPDSKIFEQFLLKNGKNLKYLSIEQHAGETEFKINTIFCLCPNLESLEMKEDIIITDSDIPNSSHGKLKELTIDSSRSFNRFLTLSNILSAPTLEKIKISGMYFDREDVINMIGLVRTGQILQRVSSFDLSCCLKQLAVGIIARDIVETVVEPQKKLQFPIIPDNMKQTVLDEVARIAETRQPRDFDTNGDFVNRSGLILDNLLNLNTVEFDSSWLLRISPHDSESGFLQMALQTVSLRAPNLKFLIIGGDPISPSCNVFSCSPTMLSCIRNIQNLTHFVTKTFSLEQLMHLCSHLELLQFVNVKTLVINDRKDTFDDLRRLKEFHFNKVKSPMPRLYGSFKKELTSNCLKYLPNLEVIGEMINWDCMDLPISGGNLQFPHFPRLEFVKMKSVPDSTVLERFLQKNGKKLKYLSIEQRAGDTEFTINTIFCLCPNLESLEMKQEIIITDSHIPISSYGKLKELTITSLADSEWMLTLSNILSAPTLEKIKISGSGVHFHLEDVIKMTDLVRTGQILQRVSSLDLSCCLKQLAVGIIAREIVDTVVKPEKELKFPVIPENMKQTVLDEVACIARKTRKLRYFDIDGDFIKRSGLILENLLSLNTVEFDSSWLLRISPHDSESGYIQMVLQTVSLRAPNLKFLIIGGDPISPSCNVFFSSPSMLSCIRNMQNLTHFVTKTFSLEQLMHLCSHLELLQFVNVKTLVINDRKDTFDDLRRLKEFHFNKVKSPMPRLHGSFKKELTSNCLKYLPNLEVIGEMVERESSFNFYHPAVIEGPSKLRHLFAYPASIQDFQRFERIFPATTHLAINWKCMNPPISGGNLQFPHFPRLEFVMMKLVPDSIILERFLLKNGKNLKYLSIEQHAVETKFKINTIFGLCPNLESLEMTQAKITDSHIPISSYGNLKELTITSFRNSEWFLTLSNILSAPTLEKINISGSRVHFHLEDVMNMIGLVRTGQILQRVSSFDLSCWYGSHDNYCFSELGSLIKNLCAYAPKLTFIDVDSYHESKMFSFTFSPQPPLILRVHRFLDAFL